jgi:thiosulfate reductase cytochrome b subunit
MEPLSTGSPPIVYRHRLPVRIMHWINVVSLTLLLMSGLQIFNAHPALYWGDDSRDSTRVLQITQKQVDGQWRGVTRVGSVEFNTHGILGTSRSAPAGHYAARAFPSWATIPGPQWLSMGRLWHFFFAWVFFINGLAYLTWTVFSGHLRRDLVPTRGEVKGIGGSIRDHLLLRHPHGEAARRYNVLQNIAYLAIVFGVLPLIVLGGWAMSPMMDSFAPGWVDFVVTGLVNNLRSMITGYWRLPK